MKKEIIEIRKVMRKTGIDAYLVPTTDYHGSEYVNDFFKERQFLSGFTGSAGTLVVTFDEALLWTDGRYFLQAETQLKDSGITLCKIGEKNVPTVKEFLERLGKNSKVIACDGRVISADFGKNLKGNLIYNNDYIDEIWDNRPKLKPGEPYEIPFSSTGMETDEKINKIRNIMRKKNVKTHLTTSLEEIAWIFNLRGKDVDNTPVFYSYCLITLDEVVLYTFKTSIKDKLNDKEIKVKGYYDIYDDIAKVEESILINEKLVNYTLYKNIPKDVRIIDDINPAEYLKSIKNPIEIKATKSAHKKDGIAMVKSIYWLQKTIGKENISELSVSDYLEKMRSQQEGFIELSFDTISAYEDHGAIVHYTPTVETDKKLEKKGLLLIDSGAHYIDGTTDITRTVALGPVTEEMRRNYTFVLKAMISLGKTVFKEGTTGAELDTIPRSILWKEGLDFNHGTGHGVGHILSVHEGPNGVGPRYTDEKILPGMITTNEPGLYFAGKYGIRLENELLCKHREKTEYGTFLGFETLTLCPFDRGVILKEILTEEEIVYLNDYHEKVYEALKDNLNEEEKGWLRNETKPL